MGQVSLQGGQGGGQRWAAAGSCNREKLKSSGLAHRQALPQVNCPRAAAASTLSSGSPPPTARSTLMRPTPARRCIAPAKGFLARFEGSQCPAPLLEHISIIDTPGVLSGEKQRVGARPSAFGAASPPLSGHGCGTAGRKSACRPMGMHSHHSWVAVLARAAKNMAASSGLNSPHILPPAASVPPHLAPAPDRQYSFIKCVEWFAARSDMVLLLFDPFKLVCVCHAALQGGSGCPTATQSATAWVPRTPQAVETPQHTRPCLCTRTKAKPRLCCSPHTFAPCPTPTLCRTSATRCARSSMRCAGTMTKCALC